MPPPHCPAPGGAPQRHSPRETLERPPTRARRLVWPWLLLASLLPLAWCCVEALVLPYPPPEPEPAQLAAVPDAEPVVTDVSQDGVLAAQAGRTVPPRPERWMKVPPCDTANRDEEAVNGGCFVRVPRRPPCKPAQYEHNGACFEAVTRSQRPDTSVDDASR